jgi:hypothetical protein
MVLDERVVPWLVQLLKRKDWSDYLMTGAANPAWLRKLKRSLPNYRTVIVWTDPPDDAVSHAQSVGASYIHVNTTGVDFLTTNWIKEVRKANLGIICGPLRESAAVQAQTMGIESVVVREPGHLYAVDGKQADAKVLGKVQSLL